MERITHNVKDQNLKLTLSFGIGLHHAGLVSTSPFSRFLKAGKKASRFIVNKASFFLVQTFNFV